MIVFGHFALEGGHEVENGVDKWVRFTIDVDFDVSAVAKQSRIDTHCCQKLTHKLIRSDWVMGISELYTYRYTELSKDSLYTYSYKEKELFEDA